VKFFEPIVSVVLALSALREIAPSPAGSPEPPLSPPPHAPTPTASDISTAINPRAPMDPSLTLSGSAEAVC
jgi:hypothetical protein